jgi:hypothetical protein
MSFSSYFFKKARIFIASSRLAFMGPGKNVVAAKAVKTSVAMAVAVSTSSSAVEKGTSSVVVSVTVAVVMLICRTVEVSVISSSDVDKITSVAVAISVTVKMPVTLDATVSESMSVFTTVMVIKDGGGVERAVDTWVTGEMWRRSLQKSVATALALRMSTRKSTTRHSFS